MVKPWDHDLLVARVNARAQKLFGKAASSVFTDAGLPSDLIAQRKRGSSNGPTIGKLERAANALDWQLPQLLGIDDPDKSADDFDHEKLRTALALIKQALGSYDTPAGENAVSHLARMIELAYGIVSKVERDQPGSSSSDLTFNALATALREMLDRQGKANETS